MKTILSFLLVISGLLSACSTPTAPIETTTPAVQNGTGGLTQAPISGEGLVLLQESCTLCHSMDRIITAHKTASEWLNTVNRMVAKASTPDSPDILDSNEIQVLVDYLSATYP